MSFNIEVGQVWTRTYKGRFGNEAGKIICYIYKVIELYESSAKTINIVTGQEACTGFEYMLRYSKPVCSSCAKRKKLKRDCLICQARADRLEMKYA